MFGNANTVGMNDPDIRWSLRRVGAFQHVRTILHLDDAEVTINRSVSATHTFTSRVISRKHATLRHVNGTWFLQDEGGLNGTYLNADKLIPKIEYALNVNDIIGFGAPLSQQNEEDSVVYRLCREVIRPSVSGSTSNSSEIAVPSNFPAVENLVAAMHLKEDPDETIAQPGSVHPSELPTSPIQEPTSPVSIIKKEIDRHCDFTMQQPDGSKSGPANGKEIVCIDLDSDEEALTSDLIKLTDEDNDEHRHEVNQTSSTKSTTKHHGNQMHINPVKANGNLHAKPKDKEGARNCNSDDVLHKMALPGGDARNVISLDLFCGDAISNSKNESFKVKATEPTDEDPAPIFKSTTGLLMASDEIAKSPSEQPSDSENEMCDDIGYSQDDEVIIISDDESYVSQKNFMAESSELSFIVKEEAMEENDAPCILEENDDWNKMFHERLMEDIANDCAADLQKSVVGDQRAVVNLETTKGTKSSSIPENIDKQLTMSESSRVSMQANDYEALAIPGPSGITTAMTEDPMDTNDFFPELSQNFYEGDQSSDSEEDDKQSDHSSDFETNTEPAKNAHALAKKPVTRTSFYSSASKDNFDRLKHKPGQMPSHGVQLMRALPITKPRRASLINPAPLLRLPLKTPSKGPSKMKRDLKKDFINKRIPIPGGGTDIRTGRRSPTKQKSGSHIKPDNNGVKSSCSGVAKQLKQDVNGTVNSSSNNASMEKKTSIMLPQEVVPRERRAPTVPCRNQKSRMEHLAAALLESTSKPPKRKGSPLRAAKPPPPKKQVMDKPTVESGKPPKKAILLPEPAPISTKHQPPVNSIRPKLPVNTSGTSNLSELDTKNKKSSRRVSFSDNPPEMRFYQPDSHTEEEHNQLQEENALGAAPQRAEVTAAVESILTSILSWKPAWLHEQEKVKHPPPVVSSKDIKDTKPIYSSHTEYVKIYEPLLLLETWEIISQDWRQRRNSSPLIQLVLSRIRQDSGGSKSKSTYFDCNAVIAEGEEERGRLPKEGWIAILDIPVNREIPGAKIDGAGGSYVRAFAHVQYCHKSTINYLQKDGRISPLLEQLISKHKDKKVTLKLVLQTKSIVFPVDEDRLLNLQMIAYLKPQLRIFQALHYLPFSQLGPHILKPKEELCSFLGGRPSGSLENVGTISYNETQRNIILKTTTTVASQNALPKVFLVQGPPGTGKSSLIIGLVAQFLFGAQVNGKAKPHILLCAPSNGAVDEILYRLIELRKILPNNKKLRMIRLGLQESIQPRVKAYSLDSIVQNNVTNEKKTLAMEINQLTTTLNGLMQKLDTMRLRNGKLSDINKLKVDINRIDSKLALFRKKLHELNHRSPEEFQRVYYNWREECLRNADVIVTTLGSCTQYGMEIFLRNNNHPFICIIDEATQCIEPEMLLPLQFGVSKLILVGDPKQLPATVISVKAKDKRLCQSLFERCDNYFGNSPTNPVVMLDVQYRMHPELCFYPSKAFYKNKLRTDSEVVRKCSGVPFRPYLFFDLCDSQEESTGVGDISNPKEAMFIVSLCEAVLLKLVEFESINLGIITFYQKQRHLIKEKLAASSTLQKLDKVEHIEVNTVDGFQGREKDLIIVSTVRANSSNGSIGFINKQQRLNVAITRAKCCLYICGHRDSLKTSPIWKDLIDDASFRRKLEKVASPIPITALQDLLTKSSR